MPRVKTFTCRGLKIEINVSSQGEFYANVPDYLSEAFDDVQPSQAKNRVRVSAETMDKLEQTLSEAINAYFEPIIKEELVILYCIEGKATFAEDDQGNIHPNAVPEGVEWTGMKKRYGNLSASNKNTGGFELLIGAKAMCKKTKSYPGGHTSVDYERYYGKHENLDNPSDPDANPALKLNSWTGFYIPETTGSFDPFGGRKSVREMAYSDEAALFFHGMMGSMAKLIKKVQDYTFDPNDLERTIEQSVMTGKLPFQADDEEKGQ